MAILPIIAGVAFISGIFWGIIYKGEKPFPPSVVLSIDLVGVTIGMILILVVTNILVKKQKEQKEELESNTLDPQSELENRPDQEQ